MVMDTIEPEVKLELIFFVGLVLIKGVRRRPDTQPLSVMMSMGKNNVCEKKD